MLRDFDTLLGEASISYAHSAFEKFGDAPHLHRWRAFWRDGLEGLPQGIELQCYPVLRLTPSGAWIDEFSWLDGWYGWVLTGDKGRWVGNASRAAWAKPTQKEALRSLSVRLLRWSQREKRTVRRINAACEVAEALLTKYYPAEFYKACAIKVAP